MAVSTTTKKKTGIVLRRGLRSLAAVLVAALAGWLAGPDALELFGTQAQAVVTGVLVPGLLMLDKYLRLQDIGPEPVEEAEDIT